MSQIFEFSSLTSKGLAAEGNTVMTITDYIPSALLAIAQREGEDARITGMTRSLHRRLLALNVPGSLAERRTVTTVRTTAATEVPAQRIA